MAKRGRDATGAVFIIRPPKGHGPLDEEEFEKRPVPDDFKRRPLGPTERTPEQEEDIYTAQRPRPPAITLSGALNRTTSGSRPFTAQEIAQGYRKL